MALANDCKENNVIKKFKMILLFKFTFEVN